MRQTGDGAFIDTEQPERVATMNSKAALGDGSGRRSGIMFESNRRRGGAGAEVRDRLGAVDEPSGSDRESGDDYYYYDGMEGRGRV